MRVLDKSPNAHHINHCTLSFCGSLFLWTLGWHWSIALFVIMAVGLFKELIWDGHEGWWGSDFRGPDLGDLAANSLGLALAAAAILWLIPARLT